MPEDSKKQITAFKRMSDNQLKVAELYAYGYSAVMIANETNLPTKHVERVIRTIELNLDIRFIHDKEERWKLFCKLYESYKKDIEKEFSHKNCLAAILKLSLRERQFVKLTAQDMSDDEIAQAMYICKNSAINMRSRIIRKLKLNTTQGSKGARRLIKMIALKSLNEEE